LVNSGEIFANDTKADHQKAANDELEQNYCGETGEGAAREFQVKRRAAPMARLTTDGPNNSRLGVQSCFLHRANPYAGGNRV
jgi:hypothetical protein